jgi:hypothetical protein
VTVTAEQWLAAQDAAADILEADLEARRVIDARIAAADEEEPGQAGLYNQILRLNMSQVNAALLTAGREAGRQPYILAARAALELATERAKGDKATGVALLMAAVTEVVRGSGVVPGEPAELVK